MEEEINKPKSFSRILDEINDIRPKCKDLIKKLQKEKEFEDKKIITFFTSFKYPVMIENEDAIMIEEALLNTDFSNKGLLLVLNSPGGSGLAAERIINLCKNYSNNNFDVLIPNKAKSAATMICFGANKIWMSTSSELGPIDPQIKINVQSGWEIIGITSLIESYDKLFKKACGCKGRIEPFLQQLERFDSRLIEEYKLARDLSSDIAVKSLKKGMLSSLTEKDIKNKIEPFLKPRKTKVHGRPIFIEQAKECSLEVGEIDVKSKLWQQIWDLFLRTNYIVNNEWAKIVESDEEIYYVSAPKSGR